MKKVIKISKKIFSNKAILYVISRYATYIIQFINSLFIAIYLGPFYLGIWGFINLVIGYISQLNFGISNSVNVIISVNKQNDAYVQKIMETDKYDNRVVLFHYVIFSKQVMNLT